MSKTILKSIIQDINYMHFCKNEVEFTIAKNNIYNKWLNDGLIEFKIYFDTQWVTNDKFKKWVS